MRKSFGATLAATLVLGALAVQQAAAEEQKPLVVVSFAGYDKLLDNIKTVTTLAGRPEAYNMLEGLVAMGTGGKGLTGLDKARPWGVAIYAGADGEYPIQGFVPATDLKQIMSLVPPMGPDGPPAPDANGVYEIKNQNQTVYLVQKGQWAVVANSRDGLKSAPAEPPAALGDLSKKYLLAVQGSIKNVPAATRDQFLAQAKFMMSMFTQQQPNETEEQFALRTASMKQAFSQFETLSKEMDGLVVGLGVDASSNSIFLDFDMTAVPGTKTAQKLSSAKDAKTDFAGFLIPNAAVTMISAGTMDDADVAQAKDMLAKFRTTAAKDLEANEDLTKEKKDLAKQLLGDAMDVLNKTLDTKKSDGGMAVVLDDGPAIVAGLAIADGAKLDKAVQKLLTDEPDLAKLVKVNAENHAGINFHVAKFPIPDEEAAAVLGQKVDVVVGIGENALYVGAGKNPLAVIKKVIDDSKKEAGKSIAPLQMTLSGASIAKFAAKVAPPDKKDEATKIANALAKSGGKDHITLTVKTIPNGASMRLNIEEGLIKAIGEVTPTPGGGPRAKKAAPGGNSPF